MLTVFVILAIGAFVLTLLAAMNRVPLWIAVVIFMPDRTLTRLAIRPLRMPALLLLALCPEWVHRSAH